MDGGAVKSYAVGDYTKGFAQIFPYYLSLGMTPEQFWEGDPWLTQAYYQADRLRVQRTSEEMWLQGLYFHQAVNASLANVFRKKGRKPETYLEEPLRLIPYTEEEQQRRAEQERQKAIAYFTKFEKQWGKKP